MSAAQRKTGSRMLLKKTRINKICTNMLRLCFHNYALLCLPTNIFAKICAYYVCTRPPWWTWCRWAVETQRRWRCSLHHATCLKNVKDQWCRQLFCCLCHLPISVTPQLSQEVLVPPARIFVQIQIHEIKYIEIHCYCWKILSLKVWAVQIQIEWPDVQRKAQCSLLLAGCSRPQFSYGAFIVNIDH